jgi:serine phosphatase RsbU (regulator of sigma subunit)
MKDKHTLVLAALKDAPMVSYELQFEKGDRLFVYTDGAPEAINKNQEAYGTQRIVDKLNTLRFATEKDTLYAVHEDIDTFVAGAEQFDDITMMGFTFWGAPSQSGDPTEHSA